MRIAGIVPLTRLLPGSFTELWDLHTNAENMFTKAHRSIRNCESMLKRVKTHKIFRHCWKMMGNCFGLLSIVWKLVGSLRLLFRRGKGVQRCCVFDSLGHVKDAFERLSLEIRKCLYKVVNKIHVQLTKTYVWHTSTLSRTEKQSFQTEWNLNLPFMFCSSRLLVIHVHFQHTRQNVSERVCDGFDLLIEPALVNQRAICSSKKIVATPCKTVNTEKIVHKTNKNILCTEPVQYPNKNVNRNESFYKQHATCEGLRKPT